MERISHFENETLLKCFFGWAKLPDYTTNYNDLKRFEKVEDTEGLKETNEMLTERFFSHQDRVILDLDSSTNKASGNCVLQARSREDCKEKFRTLPALYFIVNDDSKVHVLHDNYLR